MHAHNLRVNGFKWMRCDNDDRIEPTATTNGNWQLVKPVSACRAFRTHQLFLTFNGGFAWHLHKNEIRRADTSIRSRD